MYSSCMFDCPIKSTTSPGSLTTSENNEFPTNRIPGRRGRRGRGGLLSVLYVLGWGLEGSVRFSCFRGH